MISSFYLMMMNKGKLKDHIIGLNSVLRGPLRPSFIVTRVRGESKEKEGERGGLSEYSWRRCAGGMYRIMGRVWYEEDVGGVVDAWKYFI